MISSLRVWVRILRLPVIMQPVGTFIRVDENSLSGLNGLFVRVLLEVDLRLPLKRVMVIIDEEDTPVLLSYEKLFEDCFYCGCRRSEGHKCPTIEDRDGWLLVDWLFKDELLVYSAGVEISEETRQELHEGVMLVFPQSVYTGRGRSGARRDGRTFDNIVRGNKTWVSKADLMFKWMLDCVLSSGATVRGGAEIEADVDKGKNTMEEDEEFMETEEENNEHVQYLGSRKRGRNSEGNGKPVGFACSGMTRTYLLMGKKWNRFLCMILNCVSLVILTRIGLCLAQLVMIWKTVNGIGALKAPGPDGFRALFYNKCWDVVGPSVIILLKDFSKNGSSLRSIHDSILIAYEILLTFKRKKGRTGVMAVKLDVEKAYDKLS
ncbi:hypothetical protein D8674_031450 [Pyrus ussuriensis x Pyrus communis]|uniref:Reverse transcriptase domain-containing protein n=1 Tax=Pyrus ussuriensis x Pyrus communis TaxID=2448454 RepID=A0A5N5F477_9ROSA|nr:hypothetical protein D8674_031450 [Pyrus ussuriensis x Pyrus communis]